VLRDLARQVRHEDALGEAFPESVRVEALGLDAVFDLERSREMTPSCSSEVTPLF
jgi:hypothetical protein